MENSSLADLLLEEFDAMPPRLRKAARFVLDHPAEVAWMSMREQGRRAGVSHSTMVRLAVWLGLDSYDDLRALCAQAPRNPDGARLNPADAGQLALGEKDPIAEIPAIAGIADALADQTIGLGNAASAKKLLAAASVLAEANRLFCFGMHSGEMIARHFADVMSQLGKHATRIGLTPENGVNAEHRAGVGDAMFVASFAPYSQTTDKLAHQMLAHGVAIVAITDSQTSPLRRKARESIIVPTNSHAFFPSITAALAATEILAALTAERHSAGAEEAQERTRLRIAESGAYISFSDNKLNAFRGIIDERVTVDIA